MFLLTIFIAKIMETLQQKLHPCQLGQTENLPYTSQQEDKKTSKEYNTDRNKEERKYFEIFGIKLYFDDILILCLLYFLYKEEVHDEMLYLALILLLIS